MWLKPDASERIRSVNLMALDVESLGRLVRQLTQEVVALHAVSGRDVSPPGWAEGREGFDEVTE